MNEHKFSLKETRADLLSVSNEYYIAHSISGDFTLGAGVAKQIDKKFNIKHKLKAYYGDHETKSKAILIDNVFNLVTKPTRYDKATYSNLTKALKDMKGQAILLNISKIAMPRISSGMDGLKWLKVKSIVIDTFKDTNIEVLVCYL